MNCPHCSDERLFTNTLEENLVSMECPGCAGHWIESYQYWKWLDAHGKDLPEKPEKETANLDVLDGDHARICPECCQILARHKVGHGIDFYLDRCRNCGGFWFDKNEWEVLKSRNLHDNAHFIFSRSWQYQLLREGQESQRARWFVEKFGEEKYGEIKRFKHWLQTEEHHSAVIGFLSEKE